MHLCFIQITQRVKNNSGWVALNAASLLFSEIDRLGAECIAGVRRWVALNINRSLKRQIWPYVVVFFTFSRNTKLVEVIYQENKSMLSI